MVTLNDLLQNEESIQKLAMTKTWSLHQCDVTLLSHYNADIVTPFLMTWSLGKELTLQEHQSYTHIVNFIKLLVNLILQ